MQTRQKYFWIKIWEQKDHNKKAEWTNNMETELLILEEASKVEILLDALKATLKKCQTRKTLA